MVDKQVTSLIADFPNLSAIAAGLWLIYKRQRKAFMPFIYKTKEYANLTELEELFKDRIFKTTYKSEILYVDREYNPQGACAARYKDEVLAKFVNRNRDEDYVGRMFGYLYPGYNFSNMRYGLDHTIVAMDGTEHYFYSEKLLRSDVPEIQYYLNRIEMMVQQIGLNYKYKIKKAKRRIENNG